MNTNKTMKFYSAKNEEKYKIENGKKYNIG